MEISLYHIMNSYMFILVTGFKDVIKISEDIFFEYLAPMEKIMKASDSGDIS